MTITGDNLFVGLVILAGMLTLLAIRVNLLLFRLAAAIAWLALAGVTMLDLGLSMSDTWTQALSLVFVVMVFAAISLQFVSEIRHEGHGRVWTQWSKRQNVDRRELEQEVYRAKIQVASARARKSKKVVNSQERYRQLLRSRNG